MQVFRTTASPYPSYSFTGIVEVLDFKTHKNDEIRIRKRNETYTLTCKGGQSNSKQGFELTSSDGTKQPQESGAYVLDSDDGVIWIRHDEEGVQIGGGSAGEDVLISRPTILTDIITMKGFAKKGDPNITQRITVGALYDPACGHIFDGTVYFLFTEEYERAPIILIDFDNDVELKKSYRKITAPFEQATLNSSDASIEKDILKRTFNEFKDTKYLDEDSYRERLRKINSGIRVGPLVKRLGGVCAYQTIAVCAIIERLIKDGHLKGKVFYGQGKRHGWPLYLSQDNVLYVVDSTQRKLVNLNAYPETQFRGIEEVDGKEEYKYFRYIDFLPAETTPSPA